MRFLIAIFLSSFINSKLFSQDNFNYQIDFFNITLYSKDSTSDSFYFKLHHKYINDVSLLSNSEMLCLMIGFTKSPNYNPYDDYLDELNVQKLVKDYNYDKAIQESRLILNRNPFSIKAITSLAQIYLNQNNRDSVMLYKEKAEKIFKAMEYSGTGLDKNNAIFALGPYDGQEFVTLYKNLEIVHMGSTRDDYKNFCDVISTSESKYYFVIQHAKSYTFSESKLKELRKK